MFYMTELQNIMITSKNNLQSFSSGLMDDFSFWGGKKDLQAYDLCQLVWRLRNWSENKSVLCISVPEILLLL